MYFIHNFNLTFYEVKNNHTDVVVSKFYEIKLIYKKYYLID